MPINPKFLYIKETLEAGVSLDCTSLTRKMATEDWERDVIERMDPCKYPASLILNIGNRTLDYQKRWARKAREKNLTLVFKVDYSDN